MLSGNMIFTLATALVGLAVIAVIVVGVVRISKSLSGAASDAAALMKAVNEGMATRESEVESTPRSVSSATSLYLPQIEKDFPEFHLSEAKRRAENAVTSYLRAIDGQDMSLLTEDNAELKDHLRLAIQMLQEENMSEQYDDIQIHRTEISHYGKSDGRCVITFQMALKCRYMRFDQNGTIIAGSRDRYTQMRFETDMVYTQNPDVVGDYRQGAFGINCPNCGAPIENVGGKVCPYCGTPVAEVNIYAWSFNRVERD